MAGATSSGCPICGKPVVRGAAREPRGPRGPDPFPFCSARCQLIDLGKWLGDEYRVPDRDTVVWPPGSGEDQGHD